MSKSIYFIALIPGQEIREEVTEFKKYASRHFDSSHALKSPPHITLFPPFRREKEKEPQLFDALQHFAQSYPPFFVELNNFERFGRRVIFVDVELSVELKVCQKKLRDHLENEIGLKNKDDRPYHPHMTVAFKDLKPSDFPAAWRHFSQIDYRRIFQADQLYLLRHDGQRWQILKGAGLEGKS